MLLAKTAPPTHCVNLFRWHLVGWHTLGWLLVTASSVFGQRDNQAVPEMTRHSAASIELDGELAEHIHGVNRNWLILASEQNPGMLAMFRDQDRKPLRNLLAWSGEFAGKYLTACVEVLLVQPDEALRKHTANFVNDLIACQDSNGYLGPFPHENQLTGWAPNTWGGGGDTWDVWGHYHVMIGLLNWCQLSEDQNALTCATRIGDLLVQRFGKEESTIVSGKNAEMNHAVVHSLLLLHKHQPKPEYLKLAEKIVREFSQPDAGNYLELGLSDKPFFTGPKPRWESLHPMMGLAELYWATGDASYRQAFENLWWSITEFDRHNNGGFSSGEQAQGNPYHPGAIETCCTIAWTAMSVEMLKLTGDSRVGDELELTLLNSVCGMHSPDGSWSTYNTPMNGVRIPNTVDIAFQIRPGTEQLNCCSVNAARGFGLLSQWAIMNTEAGLAINYFGRCTLSSQYNGSSIRIEQQTDYPSNGKIRFELTTEQPTTFQLQLRIPHWTNSASLSVNGESMEAIPGHYASIKREWKTGDKIELELDLSPRFWAGEKECRGTASMYLGPILMALDGVPKSARFSDGFYNNGSSWRAMDRAGQWAEYPFHGDHIVWTGQRFRDAGMARVLIDGAEVDRVSQFGETDGEAFRWESKKLAKGPHLIRIEVMGEKVEASKGAYINIGTFEPADQIPEFSLEELVAAWQQADDKTDIPLQGSAEEMYQLRPFADCGRNRTPYTSWIPVGRLQPVTFSKENPLRLIAPAKSTQ